jgi:hypothetical protein
MHPCNIDQDGNALKMNSSNCCHFWSSSLDHNRTPLMKVMRMATGRGQSHLNISDFLQPFLNNMEVVKYPLKQNTSGHYYPYEQDEVKDKTSYLPACIYASKSSLIGQNCKLFEPVLTDLGICYSFNAKSSVKMLKDSSFTQAFLEAYKYDLPGLSIENVKGAGDKFSLRFMIDRSRNFRRISDKNLFKVIISAHGSYFDALSLAKEIKPGYETTFNIEPIEVIGTNALHDIKQEARKCKFDDEIEDDSMFKSYSQSSCEYECKIKYAREKCLCTPWNFPTLPFQATPIICDLYGNSCFHSEMNEAHVIQKCAKMCPPDCANVRFSINEQEIVLDHNLYCEDSGQDGMRLVDSLIYAPERFNDYFPLVYNYHVMAANSTIALGYGGSSKLEVRKKLCREIMATQVAVVKVRLESNKYMRTVKDRRLSFGDKLAAFGKSNKHSNDL